MPIISRKRTLIPLEFSINLKHKHFNTYYLISVGTLLIKFSSSQLRIAFVCLFCKKLLAQLLPFFRDENSGFLGFLRGPCCFLRTPYPLDYVRNKSDISVLACLCIFCPV